MRRTTCEVILFTGLAILAIFANQHASAADDLPNILWITSEDNAAQWIGCYGNEQAQTPRIDALAKKGVTFARAYSNAPVCAVARCTLLHGVYSTSLGTQHMRSRYPIPKNIRPYVSYLKEKGYYCTNSKKTDYNRAGGDKSIWDQCNRKAHYKNRAPDQPFFAIFNLTVCHESSLFPERVASNRERGVIPKTTRLKPEQIKIPPYVPDIPEMRGDFAIYHDNVTAMDKQVGGILDQLEKNGLSDSTIVFYFSDHGGPTPRGKRYLADTGVRIPMIVYVPEKWKSVSPFIAGSTTDEPVAFVDFAPTVLSLIGNETPKYMQGRAFLGQHRRKPTDDSVFLFGDRFDELVGMRRGLSTDRYKYIRRFTPHLPAAPYSFYQFSMPSWAAWRTAADSGKLSAEHTAIWEQPQPTEMLFDLKNDPWEVKNLADDPAHADVLIKFRTKLSETMQQTRDTGVVPESMFSKFKPDAIYDALSDAHRKDSLSYEKLLKAAEAATAKNVTTRDLKELLNDENEIVKYWGTIGCAAMGEAAKSTADQLTKLTNGDNATLRMSAAFALARIGRRESAIKCLLKELDRTLDETESILMCSTFFQLDCHDRVPDAWLERNLNSDRKYEKRFVDRLRTLRAETGNSHENRK